MKQLDEDEKLLRFCIQLYFSSMKVCLAIVGYMNSLFF
jgi:hypothetical protein